MHTSSLRTGLQDQTRHVTVTHHRSARRTRIWDDWGHFLIRSLVLLEYGSRTHQSLALDQQCVSGMTIVQNHDSRVMTQHGRLSGKRYLRETFFFCLESPVMMISGGGPGFPSGFTIELKS
jgi:hypothetical protein